MEKIHTRLNTAWYKKRINQNTPIKKFLIGKILENNIKVFTKEELLFLNYEDILEIAIASVNKKIKIVLGTGQDFCNNMDAKFSIVRSNSRGRSYSANVKCKLKKGLYNVVYENYHNKFYFFVLPADNIQEISIPFTLDGHPNRSNKWWSYEVDTFEKMCLMAEPTEPACNTFFNDLFKEVA
tara:strand:- start:51 stop:596 length:546 start_codon:yes stop_codon:yes gene_type:complete